MSSIMLSDHSTTCHFYSMNLAKAVGAQFEKDYYSAAMKEIKFLQGETIFQLHYFGLLPGSYTPYIASRNRL